MGGDDEDENPRRKMPYYIGREHTFGYDTTDCDSHNNGDGDGDSDIGVNSRGVQERHVPLSVSLSKPIPVPLHDACLPPLPPVACISKPLLPDHTCNDVKPAADDGSSDIHSQGRTCAHVRVSVREPLERVQVRVRVRAGGDIDNINLHDSEKGSLLVASIPERRLAPLRICDSIPKERGRERQRQRQRARILTGFPASPYDLTHSSTSNVDLLRPRPPLPQGLVQVRIIVEDDTCIKSSGGGKSKSESKSKFKPLLASLPAPVPKQFEQKKKKHLEKGKHRSVATIATPTSILRLKPVYPQSHPSPPTPENLAKQYGNGHEYEYHHDYGQNSSSIPASVSTLHLKRIKELEFVNCTLKAQVKELKGKLQLESSMVSSLTVKVQQFEREKEARMLSARKGDSYFSSIPPSVSLISPPLPPGWINEYTISV